MPNECAVPMPPKETNESARISGAFIALTECRPRGEVKVRRCKVPGVASAR
ncbi:MAG TPA: hypothetical protein VGG02_06290 [Chthoniobacterales bacterium]